MCGIIPVFKPNIAFKILVSLGLLYIQFVFNIVSRNMSVSSSIVSEDDCKIFLCPEWV